MISTPTRPVVFSGYEAALLTSMVAVLQRAVNDRVVDKASLEADLLDLIYATGIGREGRDDAAFWHHETESRHRDIARQFKSAADAPNPLDPTVCTPDLRAELNGMIFNRWAARWQRERRDRTPSILAITWETLTDAERIEVREMARRLSDFHRSMAPARRPQKENIDTVLLHLAEIFGAHTSYAGDLKKLPHSQGSLFILFAHQALRPFFDPSETSAVALARRWQRLKKVSY